MEIIKYQNRHREENIFTKTDQGWLWKMPSKYWRWGGTEENIDFVDPSGGPFVQVGQEFPELGGTVKKITVHDENTYLLTI